MPYRKECRHILMLSALLGLAPSADAGWSYSIEIFDADQWLVSSYGMAINAHGQITGMRTVFEGRIFRSAPTGTTLSELGTLGGASVGFSINDSGQVAGFSYTTPGSYGITHAVLSSANGEAPALYDLNPPGGSRSEARGVNNQGVVTGFTDAGTSLTFVYSSQTQQIASVGPAMFQPAYGRASAINNAGQIMGTIPNRDTGAPLAYRLEADGVTLTAITPLPGRNAFELGGINDAGQVAGASYIHEFGTISQQAFITSADGLQSYALGTLGEGQSTALAINPWGHTVGHSQGPSHYSFFVHSGGAMRDIETRIVNPPANFQRVQGIAGINDAGQLVGTVDYLSVRHAARFTPTAFTNSFMLFDGSARMLPQDDPLKPDARPEGLMLDLPLASGAVDLMGLHNDQTDPVIILLALESMPAGFAQTLVPDLGSPAFSVLPGTDFGAGWDLAIRYDAIPFARDTMDFAWDFSANPDVLVQRAAVVPEPLAIGPFAAMLLLMRISKRRRIPADQ